MGVSASPEPSRLQKSSPKRSREVAEVSTASTLGDAVEQKPRIQLMSEITSATGRWLPGGGRGRPQRMIR
jgi:hypothetical protein